jgi:hypothetical protein
MFSQNNKKIKKIKKKKKKTPLSLCMKTAKIVLSEITT